METDNQRDRFFRARAFAYMDTPHAQVSRSGFNPRRAMVDMLSSQREVIKYLGIRPGIVNSEDTRRENETDSAFLTRVHLKRMMVREQKNEGRNIQMSIGEQIKYWRVKREMTQQQLAEKAKCRSEYISRLENSVDNPSTGKPFNVSTGLLTQIAKALNVTIKLEDNEHRQD